MPTDPGIAERAISALSDYWSDIGRVPAPNTVARIRAAIEGRLRRVVIWGFQRVANFDSEPVGGVGADRCDATGCVRINGSGSETSYRAARGRLG